jgi:hypothetical protein
MAIISLLCILMGIIRINQLTVVACPTEYDVVGIGRAREHQ